MSNTKIYNCNTCHISKLQILNPNGKDMRVCFSVKFNPKLKIFLGKIKYDIKKKYPEFNNNSETAYLDYANTSTSVIHLAHLQLSEGQDFSVMVTVPGDPDVTHIFNCHYSQYSDAALTITGNIQSSTDSFSTKIANADTDHAKNHIRYFRIKNNGIYIARIHILYRNPGEKDWKSKKSGNYYKGNTCTWDCLTETDAKPNAEVKIKLDVKGGCDRTATETYFFREDSTKEVSYECTGTSLHAGLVNKGETFR